MKENAALDRAANAAAEEVLRVIYGDDLEGCTVSLDNVSAAIRMVFEDDALHRTEVTELHTKAFEAVQLLATPPVGGQTLSPEDLRSLLSERLDQIRELANKVLSATSPAASPTSGDSESG